MKNYVWVAVFTIINTFCTQAEAAIQLNNYWIGSTFVIEAVNDDNKSYNCFYEYYWSYDDFGKRSIKNTSGTFHVSPNFNGFGLAMNGSWVNPQTESIKTNCTPSSNSTASTNNLPGGTYSESCKGCKISGSILSCSTCNKNDGGKRKSSLDTSTCGDGGKNLICNDNGHLSCPGPC